LILFKSNATSGLSNATSGLSNATSGLSNATFFTKMNQIPYSELPRHISECNHCIETQKMYPHETIFNILEDYYFEDFDAATIPQLLEFDFRYGLSQEYQVKTLVKAYREWENSIEPYVVPTYNSWLGLQLQLLFEAKSSPVNKLLGCIKLNYCELLLALDAIHGFDWAHSNIINKTIYNPIYYAIANGHVEITQLIIKKYNPPISISDMKSALIKNNIEIIKIVVNDISLLDLKELAGISFETLRYLVDNGFVTISQDNYLALLKIAIKQVSVYTISNYDSVPVNEKINMIEYILSNIEPENTHIYAAIIFALETNSHQIAEYLLHKYNYALQDLQLNHQKLLNMALLFGNREQILFLAKNGVKITEEYVKSAYKYENPNISPAFLRSLL
jgi:hypothetical protein